MMTRYTFISDWAEVLERMMGSEAVLNKLLNKFATVYGTPVETLSGFLASSNIPEVYRYVHSVKGAAANLGITDIEETARALEYRIKSGDIDTLEDDIDLLSGVMLSVVAEIRANEGKSEKVG
jgi:HPt (histidine-containing phosphotransfer) domain-containing protein